MKFKTMIEMMNAFNDEEKCLLYLSQMRWPEGPICPHCGSFKRANWLKSRKIYWCGDCKKQFSVRTGTIFGDSRVPMQKWFMAIWLITSHKKGISSCQLAKDIGVTQKTAWFMCHRLREVTKKMGNSGPLFGIVEIDDTYVGGKEKNRHINKHITRTQGRSTKTKTPVLGMVERGGNVKAFKIKRMTGEEINIIIRKNVMAGSELITDEYKGYDHLSTGTYMHSRVNHSAKEYVRGNAHVNTIESEWALFKRGIYGIYHHISKKHLQRYLDEFIVRYNTRKVSEYERVNHFLKSVCGLRLTYKDLIT